MKRLIGIWIIFSVFMVMGCAHQTPVAYSPNKDCKLITFRPSQEPEGINGIKWETKLSTLEGMKLHKKDASYGGVEFYLRERDTFKLGNGKLIPIQYGFWREKFYTGIVTTHSLADWNALKEVVFNKYGVGAKPFTNKEEYIWFGKKAVMVLRYTDFLKEGIFYIKSDSMEKQIYRTEAK